MENKPLPSYRPPQAGVDLNNLVLEQNQKTSQYALADKFRQQYLNELVVTGEELKQTKSKSITFQQPIILSGETGVIYPNTITLIQGPAGAHKSRLAQGLCSLIIGKHNKDFIGFNFKYSKPITLCYLDTERNIKDQFPFALQQVQWEAGYRYSEHPPNFLYSSFIKIPRKDRLQALEDFVQYLKEKVNGHLFIVLDVISDLIADFNKVDESMRCIDWMNKMINEFDISFLAIIHENPGGDKARGHVGTELLNKVTTAIQISFEREMEELGIFRVSYKKNRNSHRLGFFNVRYSDRIKGLEIVPTDEITDMRGNRAEKAPINELVTFLAEVIPIEGIFGKDLIPLVISKFDTNDKTVRERLNSIIEIRKPISNPDGKTSYLYKNKDGQNICYILKSE